MYIDIYFFVSVWPDAPLCAIVQHRIEHIWLKTFILFDWIFLFIFFFSSQIGPNASAGSDDL